MAIRSILDYQDSIMVSKLVEFVGKRSVHLRLNVFDRKLMLCNHIDPLYLRTRILAKHALAI